MKNQLFTIVAIAILGWALAALVVYSDDGNFSMPGNKGVDTSHESQ